MVWAWLSSVMLIIFFVVALVCWIKVKCEKAAALAVIARIEPIEIESVSPEEQRKININLTQAWNCENDQCSICLSPYASNQIISIAKCGHRFHQSCVKHWATHKETCPLCNTAPLNLEIVHLVFEAV